MTTVFLISKFFVDGLRNKVGSILCAFKFVCFEEKPSTQHIGARCISTKAILRRCGKEPHVACPCSQKCIPANICKSYRFRVLEVVHIGKHIIHKGFFVSCQLLPYTHRRNFDRILGTYTIFGRCNNNGFSFGFGFHFAFVINNCYGLICRGPSNTIVAGICISVVTDFTLTPGMYPIRRNNKRQKDNNSYCNQASFSGAFLLSFHPFLLEIFVLLSKP